MAPRSPTAEVPPSLDAIPGLWRGDQLSQPAAPGIPTGFHTLDRQLPGSGWPVGALTEVLGHQAGIGEMRLLLPALARLTASGSTWFLITSPALARSPVLPNAAAIAGAGVLLERIILIRPASETEALWSVEQILRAGVPGMVTAWLDRASAPQLRRLQLAAEDRQVAAIVFRPDTVASDASPAPLRLRVESTTAGLAVHLIKRRGVPAAAPVLIDLPVQAGRHRVPDERFTSRRIVGRTVAAPTPGRPAHARPVA